MSKNRAHKKPPQTHRFHVEPSAEMKHDFFTELHERIAKIVAVNGDNKHKFTSDDERIEYAKIHGHVLE